MYDLQVTTEVINYVEMMRSYAYWYEVLCTVYNALLVQQFCTIFASKVKNLRH